MLEVVLEEILLITTFLTMDGSLTVLAEALVCNLLVFMTLSTTQGIEIVAAQQM